MNAVLQGQWDSLREVALEHCAAPSCAGRGIVTTGSDRYLNFLIQLLNSVSQHTKLPVEIAYRSGELSGTSLETLCSLGAALIDIAARYPETKAFAGFMLKPYAMMASSFQEILFLDADNRLLTDPAPLFDDPIYGSDGALFWRDADYSSGLSAGIPQLREMLGIRRDFNPVDTGQILIDKLRHWDGIHATAVLNAHANLVYPLSKGDKDTYCIGIELVKKSYSIVQHPPALIGSPVPSLIHFFPDKTPLFHHRAGGATKWQTSSPPPMFNGTKVGW